MNQQIQRLATQLYLSGKCKSLEDAYKQAEQRYNPFEGMDLWNALTGRKK